MAISNMQQPRQMYGLGSIVKKFTKPLKKIFKSPIGKAALLGGAAYGLGALGPGGFSNARFMSKLSAPFGKMVGGGGGREFQRNALGKFYGKFKSFWW